MSAVFSWLWAKLGIKGSIFVLVIIACGIIGLWGRWGWNNYRAAQKQVIALKGTIQGLEAKVKVYTEFQKLDQEAQGEVKKIETNAKKWLCDYFGKCPAPGRVRKPAVPKAPDVRPAPGG